MPHGKIPPRGKPPMPKRHAESPVRVLPSPAPVPKKMPIKDIPQREIPEKLPPPKEGRPPNNQPVGPKSAKKK